MTKFNDKKLGQHIKCENRSRAINVKNNICLKRQWISCFSVKMVSDGLSVMGLPSPGPYALLASLMHAQDYTADGALRYALPLFHKGRPQLLDIPGKRILLPDTSTQKVPHKIGRAHV